MIINEYIALKPTTIAITPHIITLRGKSYGIIERGAKIEYRRILEIRLI